MKIKKSNKINIVDDLGWSGWIALSILNSSSYRGPVRII